MQLLGTPAFVWDDAFFQQLVVIVTANCQPVTQFAIIKCVSHFEDLSSGERKALWCFPLIFKVGPDIERVSSSRCQNVLIYWNRIKSSQITLTLNTNLKINDTDKNQSISLITIRFALNKNGHIFSFGNFQKKEDCILPHHAPEVHTINLSQMVTVL